MSTHCAIIRKTDSGYQGIYCHSDGYPEHAGKILKEHYRDPKKVDALLALGDISILAPEVAPTDKNHSFDYKTRQEGVVVAYHRDRGDKLSKPVSGYTVRQVVSRIGCSYYYVFENGEWAEHVNRKTVYGK